jgi:DNA-binding response OmpR family regulator
MIGIVALNILVAEDDHALSDLIRGVLVSQGYSVECAEDGEKALQLIRQEIPLLIISDVEMPGMNGDRLFARVKDMGPEYVAIPFIFMTGEDDDSRCIRRINNGADGHISKPFTFDLLAAHVNGCLLNLKRREAPLENKFSDDFKLTRYGSDAVGRSQQLSYVRSLIDNLGRQRNMVPIMEADLVICWLVFCVAEAQLTGALLFVSDLYRSAPSTKTTINSRISMLVEKAIFCRHSVESDGRRQSLHLTEEFSMRFFTHIDYSMDTLRKFLH